MMSINRLNSSVKKSERDAEVSVQLADLAISLSATIQSGDEDKAKSILNQLLEMKPKLDINVPKNDNVTRAHEEEFSVKVQVEDREAVAGVFSLKVKACDTIHDLKMKFYVNHRIPIEVQRWIISKRMPPDNTTLSACGVKGPGATIYLYLVTAHSVGLTREAFDANTQAYLNGTYPLTSKDRGRLSSGSGSESLMSALHSTMPSPLSPIHSTSMTSAFHNNDKLVIQVQTSPPPSNEMKTNQESSSSTWGPSSFLPSGHPPTSVPSKSLGPIESVAMVTETSQVIPSTLKSTPLPQPPQSLPILKEQEKTAGWKCPVCTFINPPTRPGCEMCSTDRPAAYEVPPDYEMTPEEVMMIANAEDMERRAREPDPALPLSFDEKQDQLVMLALLQLQQEQTQAQALPWETRVDEEGFEMIPEAFLQEHQAAQSLIGGQVVADGLQPPLEPTLAWQSARDAQDSADEESSQDSDDGANSSKA